MLSIFHDGQALAQAAALFFVEAGREAIAARGRFRVALAGGSTPRGVYGELCKAPFSDALDWTKVDFYFGDERAVGPDDPQSNYRMARETLIDPLGVVASQVHRLRGEARPLSEAARVYEAELAESFGISPGGEPPAFDLVLLGMGDDGHTASLFPGTAALEEEARWVVANEVPALGTERLTLTLPVLNRARQVHFYVVGAKKAEMAARALAEHGEGEPLPCQRVRPEDADPMWLLDREAASALPTS